MSHEVCISESEMRPFGRRGSAWLLRGLRRIDLSPAALLERLPKTGQDEALEHALEAAAEKRKKKGK